MELWTKVGFLGLVMVVAGWIGNDPAHRVTLPLVGDAPLAVLPMIGGLCLLVVGGTMMIVAAFAERSHAIRQAQEEEGETKG
jgi:hypothetical protein